MIFTVAARLSQRGVSLRDGPSVFCGSLGGHLSANRLGDRYKAAVARAGLRSLRFHDLRHSFGSIAINRADIAQVQTWMGHADIQTTRRYLHFKERGDEAALLAGAVETKAEAAENRVANRVANSAVPSGSNETERS